MTTLVDYLSTWFISDEEIATHKTVADAQQVIIDRQMREGKRGFFEYLSLTKEVQAAGSDLGKYRDKNDNPLSVVPWWMWLAAAVAAFWYLGGLTWLKGSLARKKS